MGIKKKCRELNRCKNEFIQWLKDNNATDISIYEGEDENNEWDYYRDISAFVGETFYHVIFMMWDDKVKIDYSDGDNRHYGIPIEEFKQLF